MDNNNFNFFNHDEGNRKSRNGGSSFRRSTSLMFQIMFLLFACVFVIVLNQMQIITFGSEHLMILRVFIGLLGFMFAIVMVKILAFDSKYY